MYRHKCSQKAVRVTRGHAPDLGIVEGFKPRIKLDHNVHDLDLEQLPLGFQHLGVFLLFLRQLGHLLLKFHQCQALFLCHLGPREVHPGLAFLLWEVQVKVTRYVAANQH